MNLRQARAVSAFIEDLGEMSDKMSVHEAHLREAGIDELANIAKDYGEAFVKALKQFALMVKREP